MAEPEEFAGAEPCGDDERSLELYYFARARMDLKEYHAAVVALEESAALHPHFKTLELLGECLLALERFREAVVPLAAASTLNRQARAPTMLAEAFLRLGDVPKAADAIELALQRNPDYRKARSLAAAIESARGS